MRCGPAAWPNRHAGFGLRSVPGPGRAPIGSALALPSLASRPLALFVPSSRRRHSSLAVKAAAARTLWRRSNWRVRGASRRAFGRGTSYAASAPAPTRPAASSCSSSRSRPRSPRRWPGMGAACRSCLPAPVSPSNVSSPDEDRNLAVVRARNQTLPTLLKTQSTIQNLLLHSICLYLCEYTELSLEPAPERNRFRCYTTAYCKVTAGGPNGTWSPRGSGTAVQQRQQRILIPLERPSTRTSLSRMWWSGPGGTVENSGRGATYKRAQPRLQFSPRQFHHHPRAVRICNRLHFGKGAGARDSRPLLCPPAKSPPAAMVETTFEVRSLAEVRKLVHVLSHVPEPVFLGGYLAFRVDIHAIDRVEHAEDVRQLLQLSIDKYHWEIPHMEFVFHTAIMAHVLGITRNLLTILVDHPLHKGLHRQLKEAGGLIRAGAEACLGRLHFIASFFAYDLRETAEGALGGSHRNWIGERLNLHLDRLRTILQNGLHFPAPPPPPNA